MTELISGKYVVTMDAERRVLTDAAVAVDGAVIVAVGPTAALREAYPHATISGDPQAVVTPGYVNAHQHLTGDHLVRSCIPDAITSHDAIFDWAVPVHAAHTPHDDELSATLALMEAVGNGITTTVEAGTVAHPERVRAAAHTVGARITLGRWGWDVGDGPQAAPAAEVLAAQRELVESLVGDPLVTGWVTLVGHDLMTDELVTGASDLARELGTGLTFHLSPSPSDAVSYLDRTGRRPLVHLHELGVLGPHVLLGHGVHLDDDEIERLLDTDTAVACCPWAYVRLGQGLTVGGRHTAIRRRGGRVALGCDSENAGDAVDILRAAALFAGLARDQHMDPFGFTAHDALAMATIEGAQALGMADRIGSLEVGKQADIVVHDTRQVQWIPRSPDPVLQLIWATDGRSVRDTMIAGSWVVRDGRCCTVDLASLADAAQERQRFLLGSREQR
jgi:5-methylthioadenosine/S-adenosylhomocysteine deaminase